MEKKSKRLGLPGQLLEALYINLILQGKFTNNLLKTTNYFRGLNPAPDVINFILIAPGSLKPPASSVTLQPLTSYYSSYRPPISPNLFHAVNYHK